MLTHIVFAGIGLVSIAVGLPLALGRVPPNHWYGLRVPAALTDEYVWYEANAAVGRHLMALGFALMIVALGLALVVVLSPIAHAAVCSGLFVAGSLVVMVGGWRLANRLSRERGGEGGGERAPAGVRHDLWDRGRRGDRSGRRACQ